MEIVPTHREWQSTCDLGLQYGDFALTAIEANDQWCSFQFCAFHEGKPKYVSGKRMLTVLNEPQAFNPERVRDYKANLKLPLGNCLKTPKLICKFTELPCFHCPAYVLTPEDLPALHSSLGSSARDRHKMMIPSPSEDGLALVACSGIMGQKRDLGEKMDQFLTERKCTICSLKKDVDHEYLLRHWEPIARYQILCAHCPR